MSYRYGIALCFFSIFLSCWAIGRTVYHMQLGTRRGQPLSFYYYLRPRMMVSSCLTAIVSAIPLWMMQSGSMDYLCHYVGPSWVLPVYVLADSLCRFTLCDLLTVYLLCLTKVLQLARTRSLSLALRTGRIVLALLLAICWVLYFVFQMAWYHVLSNFIFIFYVGLLVPVIFFLHRRVNSFLPADKARIPMFERHKRLFRKFRNILTVSFALILILRITREVMFLRDSQEYYEGYGEAVRPAADVVSVVLYNFTLLGLVYMSKVFLREAVVKVKSKLKVQEEPFSKGIFMPSLSMGECKTWQQFLAFQGGNGQESAAQVPMVIIGNCQDQPARQVVTKIVPVGVVKTGPCEGLLLQHEAHTHSVATCARELTHDIHSVVSRDRNMDNVASRARGNVDNNSVADPSSQSSQSQISVWVAPEICELNPATSPFGWVCSEDIPPPPVSNECMIHSHTPNSENSMRIHHHSPPNFRRKWGSSKGAPPRGASRGGEIYEERELSVSMDTGMSLHHDVYSETD
eukprot:gb/GEZN01004725.1/.p1 GENE.gb/GEZN01004725.1/~~gb/GEZN01004725.1/.p1  ORF type:complete len:517 (-),score=28.24 gb/GEZN01004725.1/:116-1666(-)